MKRPDSRSFFLSRLLQKPAGRECPESGSPAYQESRTVLQTMADRRSIRRYKKKAVPRPVIEQILLAGSLAPSSKNRQPWRFIVLSKNAKEGFLEAMARGLKREKERPLLPQSVPFLKGAEHTLKIMQQAPVIIAVINPLGRAFGQTLSDEERISESCNAQSIGAAIENMSLAAAALGVGSLWIGDTYFAYPELLEYLQAKGELAAAFLLGYPDEAPAARPRQPLSGLIEWRS